MRRYFGGFALDWRVTEQPEALQLGEDVGAAAQLEAVHCQAVLGIFKTELILALAYRAVARAPSVASSPAAAEVTIACCCASTT